MEKNQGKEFIIDMASLCITDHSGMTNFQEKEKLCMTINRAMKVSFLMVKSMVTDV